MSDLSIDSIVYFLLFFHCLIGAIATGVAKQKGYNFWQWLVLGLIGGTVALVVIIKKESLQTKRISENSK